MRRSASSELIEKILRCCWRSCWVVEASCAVSVSLFSFFIFSERGFQSRTTSTDPTCLGRFLRLLLLHFSFFFFVKFRKHCCFKELQHTGSIEGAPSRMSARQARRGGDQHALTEQQRQFRTFLAGIEHYERLAFPTLFPTRCSGGFDDPATGHEDFHEYANELLHLPVFRFVSKDLVFLFIFFSLLFSFFEP